MTEFVIRTAVERQRYMPEELARLTDNDSILFARLNHFMRTGSHTPSLRWDKHEDIWWTVFGPSGVSPELADSIASVLQLWPQLIGGQHPARDQLEQLARERIVAGDRFVVHDADDKPDQPGVLKLHGHGIGLDGTLESKLLGAYFALAVLGIWLCRTHQRHTSLVEALAKYQQQVSAVVSESRLWRADGMINGRKAIKLLSDTVSSALGELEEKELQTVATAWRQRPQPIPKPSSMAEGLAFEAEVAALFQTCGFNVESTATTGDYGVDLVVTNPNLRLAVQVKNLAIPVGVSAVQEVSAGALHYRCSHTLVVSSNGYTEAARTLAQSTGTKLETLHSLRQQLNHYLTRVVTG